MSGIEELVRRLLGQPDNDRPLKHKGDKIGVDGLTCPFAGHGNSLGIDYAPHCDGAGDWIPKAWCRTGHHSDIDTIAAATGMTSAELREGNHNLRYKYQTRGFVPALPSEDAVRAYRRRLKSRPDKVRVLRSMGITVPVLNRWQVGLDVDERFTVPIRVSTDLVIDQLVAMRWYKPDADPTDPDDRKWQTNAGGSVHLVMPPRPGPYALCAGEKDAMRAESGGLNAATNTGGEETFRVEWARQLALQGSGFIVYDRDAAGVRGSRKAAEMIRAAGGDATIVELPLPYREKRGLDVTDFLNGGGDLRALLNEAWQKRRKPRPKPRLSSSIAPHRLPQTSGVAHV